MVNINGTSVNVRPKDGFKGYSETADKTSRYVHDVPVPLFNYMSLSQENQQFGFRPGPTQTGLYSHRRWLEGGNFVFN